jgi:hypothetical protein
MDFLLNFILVFSCLGLINFIVKFVKNLSKTPPKPFEVDIIEKLIYSSFLSYIITYLFYI